MICLRTVLFLLGGLWWLPGHAATLTLLTWNVSGNGVTDWSTNSAQVRAIGRQVSALQPDVITFNEIPYTRTYEMTNFVRAWLPGYYLATNSATDGAIRSVIVSRYPIQRSQSWLARANLAVFGYSGNFTRDLFEAEILLPGALKPLHVFTSHLKCCEDATSMQRRAAEAGAISNYLVNVFLPSKGDRQFVLTGDLNEDVLRPPAGTGLPVQRLISGTGLQLLTPTNALAGADRTISIRAGLTKRFDYILVDGILAANLRSSLVFRSDQTPLRPGVLSTDSATASDHLPVLMVFDYPDPVQRVTVSRVEKGLELSWPSLAGRTFTVESSPDLARWSVQASGLMSQSTNTTYRLSSDGPSAFFRVVRSP